MKKIMILGAGSGQLPFIKICKNKGYYVIVVSIKGDYPGFSVADKCYYYDTRDQEAILKAAQEENIDAIMTDQTDVSVPTVAYVAEKMGLRGIGYDTAMKFTDKYLMRKAAKEIGIAVPEFDQFNNVEDALQFADKIGYPLIIKPVDSSGSRGVYKISNNDELKKRFSISSNFSASRWVIVEQFITGREYLADGFAMNRKYINLDLGIKEYFNVPNIFVSSMCMFTSAAMIEDRIEKKVLEANKKLIEGMGLRFGITHAEYLYSPSDDKVYLVEVAARGGGVYLSSDITPRCSGVNTNEMLIEYLVNGVSNTINEDSLSKRVSAWKCFSFPKGKIISISPKEDVEKIEGVYKFDLSSVYVGMETDYLNNDNGKYGPVLVVADNRQQCYDILEKVKNTFKIKVQTDNGIEDLIW